MRAPTRYGTEPERSILRRDCCALLRDHQQLSWDAFQRAYAIKRGAPLSLTLPQVAELTRGVMCVDQRGQVVRLNVVLVGALATLQASERALDIAELAQRVGRHLGLPGALSNSEIMRRTGYRRWRSYLGALRGVCCVTAGPGSLVRISIAPELTPWRPRAGTVRRVTATTAARGIGSRDGHDAACVNGGHCSRTEHAITQVKSLGWIRRQAGTRYDLRRLNQADVFFDTSRLCTGEHLRNDCCSLFRKLAKCSSTSTSIPTVEFLDSYCSSWGWASSSALRRFVRGVLNFQGGHVSLVQPLREIITVLADSEGPLSLSAVAQQVGDALGLDKPLSNVALLARTGRSRYCISWATYVTGLASVFRVVSWRGPDFQVELKAKWRDWASAGRCPAEPSPAKPNRVSRAPAPACPRGTPATREPSQTIDPPARNLPVQVVSSGSASAGPRAIRAVPGRLPGHIVTSSVAAPWAPSSFPKPRVPAAPSKLYEFGAVTSQPRPAKAPVRRDDSTAPVVRRSGSPSSPPRPAEAPVRRTYAPTSTAWPSESPSLPTRCARWCSVIANCLVVWFAGSGVEFGGSRATSGASAAGCDLGTSAAVGVDISKVYYLAQLARGKACGW